MSVPSSFSSSSCTYAFTNHVFLSSDTPHGFTNNLYKALFESGIYTFIDDQRGHELTPSLVKAIQESRIFIIIFSKNYGFSSFCLDELVKVMECSKEYYRLVLPVFYQVDPSDVLYQRGTYGEALTKHREKFKEKVAEWKNALHQAASLSGWHFKPGDGQEDEFIGNIVKKISKKINRIPLHVADHPVGLEPRVREVCSLLDVGSTDVTRMVGIWGMGGIGKTTLARAVFNVTADRFDGLCYLDNVGESSTRHGLVHLQERLLSMVLGQRDIHLEDVNHGISIIKQELKSKRVLLILDDVDRLEQLMALVGKSDWFGNGSKVIIATRDQSILITHGIERVYGVGQLNHEDAVKLFTRYAFGLGSVSPSYTEILNQAVAYVYGLPLALEVVGSFLFGKTVEEWRDALAKFQEIPSYEIQETLKVSYDALEELEKNVFLDIACCFKGYDLTNVEDILSAHYAHDCDHMKYVITMLKQKSLITISSNDVVTLHPLLEAMGKEIVRWESPNEPGRRSRLWLLEDIIPILRYNTGTSAIEIIHWDFSLLQEEVQWDGMAFTKMDNLRTLIIRNGIFSRGPKHLPNSLRVLEWKRYPSKDLPSDFHPQQLAIFNLPDAHIVSPKLVDLPKTPQRVPETSVPEVLQAALLPEISETVPEVMQASQSGIPEVSHSDPEVLQTQASAEKIWRLVGLASSVIGMLCFALSPSFNRLIRGWNTFKLSVYGLLSLTICVTALCAKRSSLLRQNAKLKAYLGFAALMMISVYSYFYDKAVNGKPEILSLLSNASFALLSLCLSKLVKFGFEMGMFCFFLGCFTIQLVTIDLRFILLAIVVGCPLFIMHSSSDAQPEISNQGQDIHSFSNSRLTIDSHGQHVINISRGSMQHGINYER